MVIKISILEKKLLLAEKVVADVSAAVCANSIGLERPSYARCMLKDWHRDIATPMRNLEIGQVSSRSECTVGLLRLCTNHHRILRQPWPRSSSTSMEKDCNRRSSWCPLTHLCRHSPRSQSEGSTGVCQTSRSTCVKMQMKSFLQEYKCSTIWPRAWHRVPGVSLSFSGHCFPHGRYGGNTAESQQDGTLRIVIEVQPKAMNLPLLPRTSSRTSRVDTIYFSTSRCQLSQQPRQACKEQTKTKKKAKAKDPAPAEKRKARRARAKYAVLLQSLWLPR